MILLFLDLKNYSTVIIFVNSQQEINSSILRIQLIFEEYHQFSLFNWIIEDFNKSIMLNFKFYLLTMKTL